MSNKYKEIGITFLSFIMILGLVACSNNVEKNVETEDNEEEFVELVAENNIEEADIFAPEISEDDSMKIPDKEIEKLNLGIRMTLTDDFADCIDKDLSAEQLTAISSEAIGGFSLVKTLNNEEYILSELVVLPSSVVATPEESAKFPYLFRGNNYTIIATIPQLTEDDGDAYNEAIDIQNKIMIQLASIIFDETSIIIE